MGRERIRPGRVIDGFTVGEKLHEGGMAEIFAVTKPGCDLPLVMKVPLILEGDDPTMIVGFEQEQMILPRLSGPHVPKTIAIGDFSREPYIVMERIAGVSLLEKFKAAPLSISEVVEIGARVATALASLHRQDVVHLDLKPSNIMFRPAAEPAKVAPVLRPARPPLLSVAKPFSSISASPGTSSCPISSPRNSACPWAPRPISRPNR